MIDHDAPEPLYQQVADLIRQRVTSGEYPPRKRVPSIMELTAELGVSEPTVRKALATLKGEGTLTTTPGRGTFVAPRPGG